jgi:hypothetical protein
MRLYCITSDNVAKVGLFTRAGQPRNEKMKRDQTEKTEND